MPSLSSRFFRRFIGTSPLALLDKTVSVFSTMVITLSVSDLGGGDDRRRSLYDRCPTGEVPPMPAISERVSNYFL